MKPPLDELYLTWLYGQFADPEVASPSQTYWKVSTCLFKKEFVWFVPNDDNRAEDGRYLREEFLADLGLEVEDPDWMHMGCSMLELFVGLSRRLSFLDEGEPRDWFWHLMNTLSLRHNDRRPFRTDDVEEVLDNVIWRTYEPDGQGGLFPLKHPERDQRDEELWRQLNSYLLERS